MHQRAAHQRDGICATVAGRAKSRAGRRINRARKCCRVAPMKARRPVRKAILQRKTYEAPAEGRLNKMRLDFNENTTGCGPAVVRALRKLTPQQLAMYPEYAKPTRRIAAYFGIAEQELLLTNGGDDALRVFFDAFVEPSSHVLICEPTFPMYRYYAEIAGARIETQRSGRDMIFPL